MAEQVRSLYDQLAAVVEAGGGVYVHCSAGIHRTGMVVYGFLRSMGFSALQARQALKELRSVTGAEVGEGLLAWADQFAKPS
jgi:protein-tyrosine phosphatase